MRRTRLLRGVLIPLLLVALHRTPLTAPRAALAHSFAPAVLDLRERATGVFDVIWKMPGPESGVVTPGDERVSPGFPSTCRRLGTETSTDGPAYWQLDCGPDGLRGQRVSVSGLDGSRLDVILRVTWEDGRAASAVLRSGADTFVMPAGARRGASFGAVLWSYGRLGVDHILFGFDHLLFVMGLLLLVNSWRLLLKTITAFTVAHSLALALATFGVVHVAPALAEALIALSIVLVARELTRDPDGAPTLTTRCPWAVAFIFGLVHGLGFAGALAEVGLPPDQIPLALVSFNLGVELGQGVFVGALIPALVFFRRRVSTSRLRAAPAYALGAVAMAWTIERLEHFWM